MKPDSSLISHLSVLGDVHENEPMKLHTTYRTGGPADVLIYPHGIADLGKIIRLCSDFGTDITIIGGGSNLLVGDKGINGVVIVLAEDRPLSRGPVVTGNGLIYADSTIRKRSFLSFCVDAGYSGMEFLAGVPGCLGGGIIMNAGTIDGTFSDILENIEYLDRTGKVHSQRLSRDMVSYRHLTVEGSFVITGATFRLDRTEDRHRVQQKIQEVIDDRKAKHPLDYPSAGSVFKNPDGHSSWKLVNDSGLRGVRIGGAMVSELHTNFIINYDNATSMDIRNLIEHVQESVMSTFGIVLETEVRMLGDF